ncbi:ArdC-like ssDNA-binding domain-containing protein, partial [Rhizobium ruizarguesonis]|uniref:ArdC-like ssDNA-binding domain-containing protein n=1 Tax=Rhizobium ruizarguesonis TaxID=2081791 RepID=UPI001FE1C6F8
MSRQQSNQRSDIYSRITNTIIADLKQGVRPWTKPWTTGHAAAEVGRPLRHNGQPYTGINVLLLWSQAIARGFASSRWMTFHQAVRRESRMKGVTHGSMSSVQLCRHFPHAVLATARCEAGKEAQD